MEKAIIQLTANEQDFALTQVNRFSQQIRTECKSTIRSKQKTFFVWFAIGYAWLVGIIPISYGSLYVLTFFIHLRPPSSAIIALVSLLVLFMLWALVFGKIATRMQANRPTGEERIFLKIDDALRILQLQPNNRRGKWQNKLYEKFESSKRQVLLWQSKRLKYFDDFNQLSKTLADQFPSRLAEASLKGKEEDLRNIQTWLTIFLAYLTWPDRILLRYSIQQLSLLPSRMPTKRSAHTRVSDWLSRRAWAVYGLIAIFSLMCWIGVFAGALFFGATGANAFIAGVSVAAVIGVGLVGAYRAGRRSD